MTYDEIMEKIVELELLLSSTNKNRQRQQLQKRISDLKSRADKLEKNKPTIPFGKPLLSNVSKNILNKNQSEKKLTQRQMSNRIKNRLAQNEKIFQKLDEQPTPLKNNKKENRVDPFNKFEITKAKGSSTRPDALDIKRTSDDNNLLGGSDPTDAEMNVLEKLVSKIVGRRVRFEDIPDDDPDFGQGEGGIEYPAGRPDLRMGGMTARSGATTKFKKPLGMKGGGGLSKAQKQRIARLTQEYKQKKARKSNGKRTNR